MLAARVASGLATVRDAARLLLMDWASDRTRPFWTEARRFLRTAHFRAHAAIPAVPLDSLIPMTTQPIQLVPGLESSAVGDPVHYYTLARIAQHLAPAHVLEFGTHVGFGTATFALNTPVTTLITTIDLPVDTTIPDGLPAPDRRHVADARVLPGQHTAAFEHRITRIRADSRHWHPAIHGVGLVYVDGGHTRECIEADTATARANLAPGGWILWDDYFWLYPDVVAFLNEEAGAHTLVRIANTNLVIDTGRQRGSHQ